MAPISLHAVQTPSKLRLPPHHRRTRPVHFVALHGFLAHSGAMNSFVVMLRNALDAQNQQIMESGDVSASLLPFHITTLDARNHGLSPHTTTHVLADLVEDLKAYLAKDLPLTIQATAATSEKKEGGEDAVPQVVAVGHSMGSMTWTDYLMNSATSTTTAAKTSTMSAQNVANVKGFVSIDMPPLSARVMAPDLVQELAEIMEAMEMVHMESIKDLRSAHEEFLRCGMDDPRVRGLCTTNLALRPNAANPGHRVASWKCNLSVLANSLRSGALFFPAGYEKHQPSSPLTLEERTAFALARPSVGRVPVLSILGGSSPIGGNMTYHDVWEQYAVDVEQQVVPGASHTVYFDKPRETISLVQHFLARIL